MNESYISSTEFKSAINSVHNILEQPVEELYITNQLPLINNITDSNTVFKGKLTVLFVDMRNSTDLTDEVKSKNMVKIYRCFIRMAIQAIRYSGGYTRQFAGDGIMGIFQDSNDGEYVTSSQMAVKAARYIHTLIDYCLNPILKNSMNVSIGCGVGICTGTVMITKVGMRGKESDEKSENEMGIVWVGSTTNLASHYCSVAASCEIFIDHKTYSEINDSDAWIKTSRVKGYKSFDGYSAVNYYLSFPEEFVTEATKANEHNNPDTTFIQQLFNEVKENTIAMIEEISQKSSQLTLSLNKLEQKEQHLIARENELKKENIRLEQWNTRLNSKQKEVDRKEQSSNKQIYDLYKSIFQKTFLKNDIIGLYEKGFWLELIDKMYELGENIGKSRLDVEIDLAIYLTQIYYHFELYEDAYDALCIRAEYSSWLSVYDVEKVVKKVGKWWKLKNLLKERISEYKDFQPCLDKLKEMGY